MKATKNERRKLRKVYRKHTEHPKFLSSPIYQGDDFISTKIELISYDAEKIVVADDISDVKHFRNLMTSSGVNWLRVVGLSDVKRISNICREFGLHDFDIRDLLSQQGVTKIVSYKDVTFVMMHGFTEKEDNTLDDINVAFILGQNFVVSFLENAIPLLDDVKEVILSKDTQIRQRSSDYLLYILMTAINNTIVNSIMKIEDSLLEVEDRLLSRQDFDDIVHYLRSCRLDYTMMRRTVMAMREELPNLLHDTNNLIADNNLIYYNNFDDKIRTTINNLDGLNDLLSSLLDMYYNNNSIKMNEIMQRLTIVSTIFIPLTFLVGVWGMNFDNMPELKWKFGYQFAWIILFVVNIITLILLKKKKWF